MTIDRSIRLHRIMRGKPERLYRAFLDPRAMVKWSPPHGFVGEVLHSDPRVGGGYRMSFTNLNTGQTHAFGGTYVELVPNERIVYTDKFDNPALTSDMRVTIMLRPVLCGTEVTIIQENLPQAIPLEFCYAGWQESLHLLSLLTDPEIP